MPIAPSELKSNMSNMNRILESKLFEYILSIFDMK